MPLLLYLGTIFFYNFFTIIDITCCNWCIIKIVLVIDHVKIILLQSQHIMLAVIKNYHTLILLSQLVSLLLSASIKFLYEFTHIKIFSLSLSRYGDFSWNGHESWISRPYLTDNMNIRTRDSLHGSVAERISGDTHSNIRNIGPFYMNDNMAFTEQSSKRKLQEFKKDFQWLFNQNSIQTQTRSSPIEPSFNNELHGRGGERTKCIQNSITVNTKWVVGVGEQNTGKRKGLHDDIDLSLSLGMSSKLEEAKKIPWVEEEVNSNLYLSCSSPSERGNYSIDLNMPSKLSRLVEDNSVKSLKLASTSTLDLTI
jgi:hypothetical protein